MDKDMNRYKHSTLMLVMVMFLVFSVVILAFMGKITSEFNLSIGAILAYAGNHTFQNYRTSPSSQ